MVDDVQNRTATLLSEHCRTSGMAVSMGWTCRCGHWCENINDATGHQAAMLAEAGLLAVGQVGEVPGSPGDLAGGLAGMLRAAGLLSPPSPRARTHRGGTRACRAVDDALGTAGYDPAWIGSVGPESVWSDAPCPPVGTTWCGRGGEMLTIISPDTFGWCFAPRGEVSGGSFNIWEWGEMAVRKLFRVHFTDKPRAGPVRGDLPW